MTEKEIIDAMAMTGLPITNAPPQEPGWYHAFEKGAKEPTIVEVIPDVCDTLAVWEPVKSVRVDLSAFEWWSERPIDSCLDDRLYRTLGLKEDLLNEERELVKELLLALRDVCYDRLALKTAIGRVEMKKLIEKAQKRVE